MTPAHWTPDQIEEFSERAAILEYDGGMTRSQAEAMAMEVDEAVYAIRVKPLSVNQAWQGERAWGRVCE